jgi:hypothetical protein
MGLALPAELTGYPGPSHVLENADVLGLTIEQRESTKVLFAAMKAEAIPVGTQLIDQEARLGRYRGISDMLRQYFPKGIDLAAHSQAELNKVARQLNERAQKNAGLPVASRAI